MAMATSSDSKINLSMVNGHFIAKWQMATSLSIMANGHFTNMADGQFIYGRWPLWVTQSLLDMAIATGSRIENE